MSFDYFYGPDDAEQYSFYRIPKRLITGDEFQETSTEAKLLYGLMLDRLQLSIRNQWLDSLNRVYIIYTVEDIMADLHCGNQKACKLLSELENKTGLIKRKRQGLGNGHIQYVLDCIHDNTTDIRNIKAYMLTTLYNAPITIDHYYQAKVNHDLYGWREEDA